MKYSSDVNRVMLMFNRIPSDVAEIVVVCSKSYNLYIELKEIVEKFNDECVKIRIRDKLTEKTVDEAKICYKLNGDNNREYDKPCYLCNIYPPKRAFPVVYFRNKELLHVACLINYDGYRVYKNRRFGAKGTTDFLFLLGKCAFYQSGEREIGYKKINILEL